MVQRVMLMIFSSAPALSFLEGKVSLLRIFKFCIVFPNDQLRLDKHSQKETMSMAILNTEQHEQNK